MNKKPSVLSISDLFFAFDKLSPLLRNVSLSIAPHELVALIGPNGSGKTTLLKLMMGFLEPLKGSVSLFDAPPKTSHKLLGYVPQINIYDQQFPLSTLDVVLMGALSKLTWYGTYPKHTKEKALYALHQVGLCHVKDRPFGTLSGGQAQRALIARALVDDPQILFLDEPTANIDPETQELILQLLLSLKSSMTIVMVTHHLQTFIEHVYKVFCVQNTVTEFTPQQICAHFSMGVFHSPLIKRPGKS